MMDAQLEIKLIECLSLLEDGEPIERVLSRFPDDAYALRPLLETARMLPSLRREPSEAARQASRRAFLNEAARLREAAPRRWGWFSPRLAATFATVVLVFLLMGGVVAAAQSALPDDALYPVKRALEETRLALTPPSDRATLATSFSQRRRDEIGRLLAAQRAASVAFEGKIESIAPGRWQVAGLPVQVGPATDIKGAPSVGAWAQVAGHTAAGQLFADTITVEAGGAPAPTAAPTASATPSATPSPSPNATARPSATATPLATATNLPTRTPAPAIAPAAPTARPTRAPQPTRAPEAEPTRAPEAEPTEAPQPTEAADAEVEFEGVVEAIGGGWRIGGQSVAIDAATEIRGQINVGDTVRVRALRRPDGQLVARRIELRSGGGDNSGGGGGGDDHGGGGGGGDGGGDHGGGGGGGDGGGDHGGGGDSGGGGGGGDHGGGGSGDHGGESKPIRQESRAQRQAMPATHANARLLTAPR